MTHRIPPRRFLAPLALSVVLAGCAATNPQAGRDQLALSIAPELRLLHVDTAGLETFQTIRLAQLKAITDEHHLESFERKFRAELVIEKARAEPAYGEGRADLR